jgi:hypothetical protein
LLETLMLKSSEGKALIGLSLHSVALMRARISALTPKEYEPYQKIEL